MSAVTESEQALAYWRDYCRAVLSWPDMPTTSGTTHKYKRHPLRCVVSREIIRQRISWGTTLLLYHEVLSCGHPFTSMPNMEADYTALRRRCAACGEAEVRTTAPPHIQVTGSRECGDAPRRGPIHLPTRRPAA